MKHYVNKLSRMYRSVRIGICMGTAMLAASTMIHVLQPATVYAADYQDVYYEGVAQGKVNVRVGAGQDNEQVTHNGQNVQLKAGDKVTVIGEEMVGDKKWYKVRFMIGEDEIIGYSTSSYLTRTDVTITPSPTPTPEATPTPTPTLTPTPTPTPEVTAAPETPVEDKDDKKSSGKGGIIAAIIVVILAGGALIFLKSHKAQAAGRAASRKLAQIKKAKPAKQAEEEEDSRGRRKPEVKTKANYREAQAQQMYQDVYLKKNPEREVQRPEYSYIDQEKSEAVQENAARESEERKALREEIENLREHDLVIHKYFGKGEVFDNSDVRLIEVRFGGEARFMNKDALAAKKLMKKCSEDTMRYHRRATDRQPKDDYFDE